VRRATAFAQRTTAWLQLELYLPEKRSNADCTLCMDCVKACPHDNIGILPRSMTQDVLASEPTSSLGTIEPQDDVAAAAWYGVVRMQRRWWGQGLAFWRLQDGGRRGWLPAWQLCCVVAGNALAAAVVWLSRRPLAVAIRGGRRFCRGALGWCRWAWGCGRPICCSSADGCAGLLPLGAASWSGLRLHWMSAPQWGCND